MKGRVTVDSSTNGAVIAGAKIVMERSHFAAVSDSAGMFKLLIPDSLKMDILSLSITKQGFTTYNLIVTPQTITQFQNIRMATIKASCEQAIQGYVGAISVIVSKKKKWWQRLFN